MKKVALLPMAAAVAYLYMGCAGSMPPPKYFEDMERQAMDGESEIVVSRPSRFTGSIVDMRVVIDDQERLRIKNGESSSVVVPDGTHTIYANHPAASNNAGRQRAITVNAAGSRIVFEAKYNAWDNDGIWASAPLNKYMEISLDGSTAPPAIGNYEATASGYSESKANPNAVGLDDAVKMASSKLMIKIPDGSKIAVVNIAVEDRATANLIIEEVQLNLLSANRFKVVDRNTLDVIISEQNFQMSGAVSDNDVVRIGNMTGANVVITGSVLKTGDSNVNRLGLKALDVKTAELIEMARGTYDIGKFGGQRAHPPKQTASTAPKPTHNATQRSTAYVYQNEYKNFTAGERFGTWALNWLVPGVGSLAIMQDWGGAITQWVLVVGGYVMILNGVDTYEETYGTGFYQYTETYAEPNALLYIGVGALVSNFTFNIIRSAAYQKKRPNNMASLENTGFNLAVLPDKDGNVKGYLAYRMEF